MAGSERSGLPQGTAGWAKALLAQQLPALARTAQGISECVGDDDTSGTELAALILRDAGMTTRVLRLEEDHGRWSAEQQCDAQSSTDNPENNCRAS